MRIQQFLEHHGVKANPFAEEDAQTDLVFKEHCIASTYHPAWDKIYGDPAEPTTSIVFGEKGAGKTALRLQIARHLDQYNRENHGRRLFVIEYDDFNPFLDRFRDRLTVRRRRADRALAEWKLWDHMDAILSLGVTMLVDRVLEVAQPSGPAGFDVSPAEVRRLDRYQARDLLLLAACYDQSTAETFKGRWHRLRKKLGFSVWRAQWDLAVGILTTVAVVLLSLAIGFQGDWSWSASIWPYLIILAGWTPRLWRMAKWWMKAWAIARHVRVGKHAVNPLRQVLMNFSTAETTTQPMPDKDRTDDRYELLIKFQGILKTLGYSGIVVLVDRVDEPHLINGSAEQMRALVWPLLDNKFLKHPGMGFKLLLPIDLSRFVDRESRDFYERARLDKQNLVPSLEWTGEALYDLANARLRACAVEGARPKLRDLFVESVSEQRLLEALRSLRVPRHVFKFMYRLLVAHCNTCTDERPIWKISSEQFESVLALYLRDQDAFERGLKTV